MSARPPLHQTAYSYRADAHIPAFADDKPIIIFDGECVLCSGFAQFVLRHDRQQRFRLLMSQSPLGMALYRHYGLDPANYTTNILIKDGHAWFKSTGSIMMFVQLGLPWSLACVFRILPVPLRDKLYDIVAANRLRWFGQRLCFVPSPADAERFLS
jgi:predicted DCC family thiol-disulfide oxidoreductase YuxK